jgi:hypothetical protein
MQHNILTDHPLIYMAQAIDKGNRMNPYEHQQQDMQYTFLYQET